MLLAFPIILINLSPNAQAQQQELENSDDSEVLTANQTGPIQNQTASPLNDMEGEDNPDVGLGSLMEEGRVGSPDEPFNPDQRKKLVSRQFPHFRRPELSGLANHMDNQ